jgi:hypothetical protein
MARNTPQGPFNGLFPNTKGYVLAEIFAHEKGAGYEFDRAEFASATGLHRDTAIRTLYALVERGLVACYPHPKYKGREMFRISWPVEVIKKRKEVSVSEPVTAVVSDKEEVCTCDLHAALMSPVQTGVFSVTLYGPEDKEEVYVLDNVSASGPAEAVEIARNSLRAHVVQEWEF